MFLWRFETDVAGRYGNFRGGKSELLICRIDGLPLLDL
jgi:hypothetical protein